MKYVAIASVVSIGGFVMLYENDYHFQTQVDGAMRIGAYGLVAVLVFGLIYAFFRYLMPAINDSLDRANERKLKQSRFAPSTTGLYELPANWMHDERTLQALLMAAVQSQIENPRTLVNPTSEAQLATNAPGMIVDKELPPITDLATLNFKPSRERILLGLGENNEHITVSVPQLCHVAFVGATGGGKSNLMRLVIPQLLAVGADVILADPHYADYDVESGDDWRAIREKMSTRPAIKPSEIDAVLNYFIEQLHKRLELRASGKSWGRSLFLAFDELPVIVDSVKDAPERLGKILREGRKVGLYTIGASQDFLVKTIGGSTGIRDCYRTAVYVGGDRVSASSLLDMPQKTIDDSKLSMGIAYLRCAVTQPARIVRIPYASNQGVAGLLGVSSTVSSENTLDTNGYAPNGVDAIDTLENSGLGGNCQTIDISDIPHSNGVNSSVNTSQSVDTDSDTRKYWYCKVLSEQGLSKTAIIKQVWSNLNGRNYSDISAEYDAIIARIKSEEV